MIPPLDTSQMLAEEATWRGAHFQHIVDRNRWLRDRRLPPQHHRLRD